MKIIAFTNSAVRKTHALFLNIKTFTIIASRSGCLQVEKVIFGLSPA